MLRPYQSQLESQVYAAWNEGHRNAMVAAATGSGKTRLFCKFLNDINEYRLACAHRQELVSQMACTLGEYKVRHRIIAPDNVRRMIIAMQIAQNGTSYEDPRARCIVAGVDTLVRMPEQEYDKQVIFQVQDEAHHVLRENKWGKVMQRYPNAYGLLPTATPIRADGKGLGRATDGLADCLILAPDMREIIEMGYLTDYRLVIAESDIQMSDDDITDTGDFNQTKLRKAHHESKKIVGDVVSTYLAVARGKLGITFAVDVEEATRIAKGYRDAGVPAEVVSAKTPDQLRAAIIRRFKNREILQLVNVDLFGEGFDLPALEVVSFARHTASFALYSQQFGRALRLMLAQHLFGAWDSYTPAERKYFISISQKPRAIIIDHVGNILRHNGPPDAEARAASFSLDRRERRSSKPSDAVPYRTCANKDIENPNRPKNDPVPDSAIPCTNAYPRVLVKCPDCGHHPEPPSRKDPEHVDGDMFELDDEAMRNMRKGYMQNITAPIAPKGMAPEVQGRLDRQHWEKQQAVILVRNAIAWWAGLQDAQGRSHAESYRRFYYKFGIDVGGAQMLGRAEAEALYKRIAAELAKSQIDASVNAGLHLLS